MVLWFLVPSRTFLYRKCSQRGLSKPKEIPACIWIQLFISHHPSQLVHTGNNQHLLSKYFSVRKNIRVFFVTWLNVLHPLFWMFLGPKSDSSHRNESVCGYFFLKNILGELFLLRWIVFKHFSLLFRDLQFNFPHSPINKVASEEQRRCCTAKFRE